ncbi:hypothetical protein [Flavobacterium rhizosphaerae]|uniref:Lipocalin-like domain-containing protein n=1 Tax=Flavobacterium rhizosphaerae TaxID=3163298 RepID=A0ABW8YT72_9FLAO
MFNKITFLSLFMLFGCIGFSQTTDCTQFKNGKFKVTDPASKQVCYITRDGNTQTERMEDSDEEYNFDIVWIDDCTYTVTPTASALQLNKELDKTGTMTVKITKTKENSYIQRVTVANNPKFRRMDEVFVVKE